MKQRDENKLLGAAPVERNMMINSVPSWMLVRPGDRCIICSARVKQTGYCRRIINLSCGKCLMVMVGSDGNTLGVYNAKEVEMADHVARSEHITTYEALLKHYEPKGMSTASY